MAIYRYYVQVPHDNYLQWKLNTNGNGYDVDNHYGSQCWDFASLFWWNIGFPAGYPHLRASSAYTMWELRDENSSYNGVTYFDFVYNVNDVKRGDIMVFKFNSYNPYGHVGFADVDFSTWSPSDPSQPYEFPILSQNNGGFPDPQGGSCVNVHGYDYRLFLGAFRYKEWIEPTPVTVTKKPTAKRFPWAIYARKFRNGR